VRAAWAALWTEHLGGLEVNDELKFGRRLHRHVGRLLALENAILVRTTRNIPLTDTGGRDYGVYVSCGWRIVHDCSRIVTTRVATNGIIAGENRTDDDENCNDGGGAPQVIVLDLSRTTL
jgi:hypothetical protein